MRNAPEDTVQDNIKDLQQLVNFATTALHNLKGLEKDLFEQASEIYDLEKENEELSEGYKELEDELNNKERGLRLFIQHLIDHSSALTYDVMWLIESGQFERARLLLKGG